MMDQRQSLLDDDTTPTQERSNVFGDENEVDDEFEWDGIADGFRPNVDRDEGVSQLRQEDEVDGRPIRTISAHYAPGNVTSTMAASTSRSSTRKTRTHPNPFASPEDHGATTPTGQRNSLQFEPDDVVRRSTSSASSSQFAPTHSPRFGAGPSHPYNIYPQTILGRTLSTATQSTITALSGRQSYSNNVPAHPYALYPQGVAGDMDDDHDDDDTDDFGIRQNPVPVGFPGLGQNYTRRLGPDGEDQDLIGEDGHTEQLPPYTRYPEDAPEKAPLLMPTAPTALLSRAPVAGTDPSMPLMHTMIQPAASTAPQSMTDESTLHRHSSRMSAMALIGPDSSSEDDGIITARKKWKDKSWKEKRKTRFCALGTFRGVAFQWILVVVCVLVFVTALLGGVIGGFVAGGQHARNKNPSVTVVTSLYDASIIASPTSGAPPTGTYALTLGDPEETQSDCLADKSQKIAWDCNLAPNSALAVVVGQPPSAPGLGAVLQYASYDQEIAYGAQLNNMNTTFAQFLTVQDKDDKENGPAFYFQQFYDKVVVVPELAIQPGNDKRMGKRGWYSSGWRVPDAWTSRKQLAHPGEKPWFCVWNETLLEGFIYVTESITTTTTTATYPTKSASNANVTTTLPPSMPAQVTVTPAPTKTTAFSTDVASPTGPPNGADIITKTLALSLTTATFTGPASAYGHWSYGMIEDTKRRAAYAHILPQKRGDDPPGQDFWSTLDVFPFLVKLEERRVEGAPSPYCQQYQILNNGQANWVGDEDGEPIIVQLDETDPDYGDTESVTVDNKRAHKRGVPHACHCQWMSGENK